MRTTISAARTTRCMITFASSINQVDPIFLRDNLHDASMEGVCMIIDQLIVFLFCNTGNSTAMTVVKI